MESQLLNIIKQQGDRLRLTVNTPLLLNNPDKIYLIESGKIVVCTTLVGNHGLDKILTQKKYFFFEPQVNQIFFGIHVKKESPIALVAEVMEETYVYECSLSLVQEVITNGNENLRKEATKYINEWIANVFEGVIANNVNVASSINWIIDKERTTFIKIGEIFTSSTIVWCEVESPTQLVFNGLVDIDISKRKFILAVSRKIFYTANQPCNILRILSTQELVETGKIWKCLFYFINIILESEYLEILQNIEIEKQRLVTKFINDEQDFKKSLYSVKTAVNARDSIFDLDVETEIEDALFKVCKIIGTYYKVDIVLPDNYHSTKDKLDDICRYSKIRYREILLDDEHWFTYKSGPLIGFETGTKSPLAILPKETGGYEAYNPETGEKFAINGRSSQRIDITAYMLYMPLPDEKITLMVLLKFAFSHDRKDLFTLIAMGLFSTLLGMLSPIISGVLFDYVIPYAERQQLVFVTLALFSATLGQILFDVTRSFALLRMEGESDLRLQSAIWDRILNLPTQFFKQFTAGDLASRTMGINTIRVILSNVTISSILGAIFSLLNFFLLFYYSIPLAFLSILLVIFYGGVMYLFARQQIIRDGFFYEVYGKTSGIVLQLFSGIAKFRVTGSEHKAFSYWLKHFVEMRKLSNTTARINIVQGVVNSFFGVLSTIVIYFALIWWNSSEEMTTGQFVSFSAAYGNFLGAMLGVSGSLLAMIKVVPLYDRTKPILESETENTMAKQPPQQLMGEIDINHVSFRYDKDGAYTLEEIDISIKEGDFVALVGPSGSGKSTIVRLLLGFEQPESGTILYDKQDIQTIDTRMLRRQLGVVLQDSKLMPGDIFTNIVGASTQLTMADAWAAARMASIDKDISQMPMGMHTVISEGAGTFSGGQRQRLMIARALVNKPKILIFDEATSALDNKTQAEITEAIDNLQVTRIVIAHRLSTIVNADKIYYLENGKVLESGSFNELMKKNGHFKKLAERQLV